MKKDILLPNKKRSRLLLVDLDGTLINIDNFKNAIFTSLSNESSLSFNKVKNIYSDVRRGANKENWPLRFAGKISKITGAPKSRLYDLIFDEIKAVKLQTKTLNFVKKYQGIKILFTLGDNKLQNTKIKFLELDKYFDRVIVVPTSKLKYLEPLIKNNYMKINGRLFNEVLIVDDMDVLMKKLLKYPWIKVLNPKDIS